MHDDIPLGIVEDAEYEIDELTDDQRRTARAVTERMLIVPRYTRSGIATGLYEVYSQSQNQYAVALPNVACDCPDLVYNAPEKCKHIRRVEMLAQHDHYVLPAPDEDVEPYADALRRLKVAFDTERDMLLTRLAKHVDPDEDSLENPEDTREEYELVDWWCEVLSDHHILRFF